MMLKCHLSQNKLDPYNVRTNFVETAHSSRLILAQHFKAGLLVLQTEKMDKYSSLTNQRLHLRHCIVNKELPILEKAEQKGDLQDSLAVLENKAYVLNQCQYSQNTASCIILQCTV